MNYFKKHNSYIIIKGTKLFRKAINSNVCEEMFFGFSPLATYSSSNNHLRLIQIWETNYDIEVFLMLKENSTINRKYSSIIEIYNSIFPNNQLDKNYYVELKKYSNERSHLVQFLKSKKITNWICSLENKYEMELFLFDGIENNSNVVSYLKTVTSNSDCLIDVDTFNHNMINYSL